MADDNGSRAAAEAAGLRFCLLGPVQVLVHGRNVPIGGPGMRGVLAMLLLEPNQVVPLDRIVDVMWSHEPPSSARTMVQGYVSRLRQRLAAVDVGGDDGEVRIATAPPGYRIEVDEALIDVTVARSLLAEARGTAAVRRAELLRQAQALWRGTELADLGGRLTAPELTELRLAVLEARFDADLELGRHQEIIGELTQLVDEQPFRERLVGQLVLALYRSGRRATALAAYQRFAHRAADELGMDPGPQLRGLHLRVLRDDTTLLEPSPEPVVSPRIGVLVPAQLPRAPSGFAGREDELAWLADLLPAGSAESRVEAALAVLAGPAGVGKTALAVLWAHRVADRFPDGQLFASLRGFDPQHAPLAAADVLTQFLLALGVSVEDVPEQLDDRAALYRSILADRRVLVVLDDARDSEQIHPLLPAGSSSLAVVTTRVRLDALVARTGARMQVLGTLAASAAEQLLEHMAGTPAQGRDRELRRRLARLCGHLPLALRIAGARLAGGPQWSVADVVAELADERGRLSALDLEDADTSVRAALDVTFRSLRSEHAETVRLLGLFPGAMIGPYPVAALCGIDVEQAKRRLRTLAASFVVTETSPDVFVMHDLVRLHAHERAEQEMSEVDKAAALARLRHYYLVGADLAKRQLRAGNTGEPSALEEFPDAPRVRMSSPADAVDWIDHEWANMLAVVESGQETGQDQEIVRLARVASEFTEGTRALGPVVVGRAVRMVV